MHPGARQRAAIVYRVIPATAEPSRARQFFIRQIEPGVAVFFNSTRPLSLPRAAARRPRRSVAREVITKLHECVHRISIKTKTQFLPGKIPDERPTYVGDNNAVRKSAIDILAAINTRRVGPRVFAHTCRIYYPASALNRDILYGRANEKRRAVTEERGRRENYAPPRISRRGDALIPDGCAILYKKDIWRSRPIAGAICIINRAFSRAVVDFFSAEFYVNFARGEKVKRLNNKVM